VYIFIKQSVSQLNHICIALLYVVTKTTNATVTTKEYALSQKSCAAVVF